jgi:hypothetical protein
LRSCWVRCGEVGLIELVVAPGGRAQGWTVRWALGVLRCVDPVVDTNGGDVDGGEVTTMTTTMTTESFAR